jgi:hypothetical protein
VLGPETILKIKSGASKKGYEDINSLELKPVGVYHGIVLGDYIPEDNSMIYANWLELK